MQNNLQPSTWNPYGAPDRLDFICFHFRLVAEEITAMTTLVAIPKKHDAFDFTIWDQERLIGRPVSIGSECIYQSYNGRGVSCIQ